jgi:hypothetical protein
MSTAEERKESLFRSIAKSKRSMRGPPPNAFNAANKSIKTLEFQVDKDREPKTPVELSKSRSNFYNKLGISNQILWFTISNYYRGVKERYPLEER